MAEADYAFMRLLYDAYLKASPDVRQDFSKVVDKLLKGSGG